MATVSLLRNVPGIETCIKKVGKEVGLSRERKRSQASHFAETTAQLNPWGNLEIKIFSKLS